MASRCRSLSRPAFSLLKSSSAAAAKNRAGINPSSSSHLLSPATPSFPRATRRLGSLESLLPFHSAVSSARLTSRLGIDSTTGSRSLSQGTLCRSNPGV